MHVRAVSVRRLGAVAILGAIGLVVACSGGGVQNGACAKNGNCPNDPPLTATQASQCQIALGDPKCGALFSRYYRCALEQEKCTDAGVTDDAATRAAIVANCSDAAAQYQTCTGQTTEPHCGLTGLPCCTDGSAPCASTGCCDPATNECVGLGTACAASNSVCAANSCSPCGSPGAPCCPTFGTPSPNPCPFGGCCNYATDANGAQCIAEGGQCDAPGPNTVETVCNSGSCVTCGSELGLCCAGGTCNDPNLHCSGTTCMP